MTDVRPFGWDVDVEVYVTILKTKLVTLHYRGCSEAAARRKAVLRSLGGRVVAIRPLTEQQWIAAYGIGRM